MKKHVCPSNASVGIIIATHAAPAYCELHLACLDKHEPNVHKLLHDDSSPKEGELREIAKKWGADFVSTDHHKIETVGDLSAFSEGLKWGLNKGLDLVFKCSRRFIVDKPWSAGVVELLANTGYATACAPCCNFNFGYRSEAVCLHVKSWVDAGVMDEMQGYVDRDSAYGFPEGFQHEKARQVHAFIHNPAGANIADTSRDDVDLTLRSEHYFARPANYNGYAWWPLLGLSRTQKMDGLLWHDSHEAPAYLELSQAYGLKWTLEDFLLQPRQ